MRVATPLLCERFGLGQLAARPARLSAPKPISTISRKSPIPWHAHEKPPSRAGPGLAPGHLLRDQRGELLAVGVGRRGRHGERGHDERRSEHRWLRSWEARRLAGGTADGGSNDQRMSRGMSIDEGKQIDRLLFRL